MMEIDKKKNMVYGQQKEAASKLSPEVEAKMNELSPKAFTIADKTIEAYGKPVEEYDDIDRATMAGLVQRNDYGYRLSETSLFGTDVSKNRKSTGFSFRRKGKCEFTQPEAQRN